VPLPPRFVIDFPIETQTLQPAHLDCVIAGLIAFCPLCNTAIVFDRRVRGQTLRFGTTGNLRRSDMVRWSARDVVAAGHWRGACRGPGRAPVQVRLARLRGGCLLLLAGVGIAPIWCISVIWSNTSAHSVTLPSVIRNMHMPEMFICLPVGGIPINSPVWVPVVR